MIPFRPSTMNWTAMEAVMRPRILVMALEPFSPRMRVIAEEKYRITKISKDWMSSDRITT